jgi:DNA-binding HxlR family transcriptional regulator
MGRADLVAFCDHETELLDKKNVKSGPTKKQIVNDGVKADILAHLTEEPMTLDEIQALVPSLADFSNQKISALITQLKDDGKVVRTVIQRKAYFAKA